MPLTFAGTLDRRAVTAAVDQLTELVGSTQVAHAWEQESMLPGFTVGGLTRHLVSQPECAVEFLTVPGPPDSPVLTLVGHYDRVDVGSRASCRCLALSRAIALLSVM